LDAVHQKIVAAIYTGSTIDEAATLAGVNTHTARRWLSTGRRDPDGKHGEFAQTVDNTRAGVADPKGIARAFISACAVAFSSANADADECPPLTRASAAIDALGSDRGKVEVQMAWHVIVLVTKFFMETGDKDLNAGLAALYALVDDVDRAKGD
jgi:hypothetical protein